MGIRDSEVVFGMRSVIEAIRSGREIEKILIKNDLRGELYQELFSLVKQNKLPFQFVPVEKINRITRKNHQGVVAVISPIEYTNLDRLLPALYEKGEIPFFLMLDGVTDVRNLGAIARTAECAGVHGLIIPDRRVARINPDAVRTSAGALYHLPVCRISGIKGTLIYLKESGLQIIAATEGGDMNYFDPDYNRPTLIVVGAEDRGIGREVLARSDGHVKIPMKGRTESLNVSVAAAIVVFEVVRQRELSS
ncbi:MAG: 23S rRNA (guanosine(2251)-2'-O)-methyltransferase RlmB [Bacteroidales bacterium]|nr:MAG: 23S rRNA (guanosine(2251)-2'-O)-methyltransferase RlmB [Bacteroidales bacterium]